jgi:hypothetical protein
MEVRGARCERREAISSGIAVDFMLPSGSLLTQAMVHEAVATRWPSRVISPS